jgi:protein ImuB
VDARGALTTPPIELVAGRAVLGISAWAGPWPLDERWWSPETARSVYRFQTVDSTGCAWLLALDDGGWWAEARYD